MKPSPSDLYALRVIAPDPVTEIFVTDGDMQRIAQGLGQLELEVPPGVYKARFRSGAAQYDELVVVDGKVDPVEVHGPMIAFHSSAPIADTATTHEYHSEPARQLSRETHHHIGTGSGLFVFLRDEDKDSDEFRPDAVSLHRLDGSPLSRLSDAPHDDQWKFAGWSAEVDPGTYRLRVDTGTLGRYEMFVTTSQDWQTQVFLVTEDFWLDRKSIRRASLRQAAVLMARPGEGFDPQRQDARLAEQARLGLLQGRDVVPKGDLTSMLNQKFGDPMLGIYACHLMLLKRRLNRELFGIVMGNLGHLVAGHPDVVALQLREEDDRSSRSDRASRRQVSFDAPPMLRRSWDLIVAASRRRASLVPRGSVAADIAENLAAGDPWLVHRATQVAADQPVLEDLDMDLDTGAFEQATHVAPPAPVSIKTSLELMERIIAVDPQVIQNIWRSAETDEGRFTGLEQTLLSAVAPVMSESVRSLMTEKGRHRSARRIMNRLDAPSYALADSIQSLARKLDIEG